MNIRFAAAALVVLSSCGPATLTLPEQAVDRAATCGVVAAAAARAATADIKAPLPFEAQGRVLHYPLLAAAEGDSFSPEIASAVSKRMSELQDEITSGKWRELAPECRAAYPRAGVTDVSLPDDRFLAQLGCDELGDFMSTALQSQDSDYGEQLGAYHDLERTFDRTLGPGLRSRAGEGLKEQGALRDKAMAAIVKMGSPVAVMRLCVDRFGGS